METWLALAVVLVEVAFQLVVVGVVLLREPQRQSSVLAWVVFVLAVPIFGGLAFLLLGEERLGARRLRRHREIQERVHARCAQHWSRVPYPPLERPDQSIATLAESVGGTAPRAGNAVDLMGDTDSFVDALVADIDAAECYCHLLFYIYVTDATGRRVADALRRAVKRGIACRLLVDGVGSRRFLNSRLADDLREAGVRVVEALPASLLRAFFARIDLRNHRKLAIVDGRVGYAGSQNVADEDFAPRFRRGPWVDAMVRIEGPVVRDLHEVFVMDWYLDADELLIELLADAGEALEDGVTVQILPSGPGSGSEAMTHVVQATLHMAQEEVLMTTPYFVPDEATASGLATVARRGVHTVLVVPARNDSPLVQLASRSYYQELLDAGVEIHEYTAGLLHSKTVTVDRRIGLIGSANLDRRSFELNFEVSALVLDSDFASRLRLLQRTYMERARRIDARRWRQRGVTRRLVENAAGLMSPLL